MILETGKDHFCDRDGVKVDSDQKKNTNAATVPVGTTMTVAK
jgi:hypothetical protein